MDADLDNPLATALYARTDDLLKSFPEHLPCRPHGRYRPGDLRRRERCPRLFSGTPERADSLECGIAGAGSTFYALSS